MKKLTIEWKHFDKSGKTCDRCSSTGDNLKQVIEEMSPTLSLKGYSIELVETKLGAEDMLESNSVLINGVPVEKLLNASVDENSCVSCGDLIDGPCSCRTVKVGPDTYEAISPELIKEAILKSLNNESNNLKENSMKIQVLGAGCPTCKKLFEITKKAEVFQCPTCTQSIPYPEDTSWPLEFIMVGLRSEIVRPTGYD